MRMKCRGSGQKVADHSEASCDARVCPHCNVPIGITKNGYLRAHSLLSKAQEAYEKGRKHQQWKAKRAHRIDSITSGKTRNMETSPPLELIR